MKCWRSRIAAAAVVGIAAVTIPLTAGTASATDPDGFRLVGGLMSHHTCQVEGQALLDEGLYREFQCRWNAPIWEVWVR
jgi:anti-sigma-K factor RskA